MLDIEMSVGRAGRHKGLQLDDEAVGVEPFAIGVWHQYGYVLTDEVVEALRAVNRAGRNKLAVPLVIALRALDRSRDDVGHLLGRHA